jgi:ribosome modulation factor
MIKDGVGPIDPYGEGMDAHSRRLSRAECPYPTDSEDEARWLAGWDRQQLNEGDFGTAEDKAAG